MYFNKSILFYSLLFFLLSISHNIAQESKIINCITEQPENFSEIEIQNKSIFDDYYNDYFNKIQSKNSTAITDVPAKIHIVTDSNGATSITLNEILDEIDEANEYLSNSFLRINVCDDINYIANNQLYNFNIDDAGTLYANHQADIMNIYFVESITFGNGNACGFTYLPGNTDQNGNPAQIYDVIVMDNQCTSNSVSTTLVHEFGHHFNLIHTHGVSNSELTDELVNGSNCITAGDRVCDTPADPQLNSSNVDTINCMYTGNETDSVGQFFDPDTSNIMSYSPNTCIDFFSEQQYARMYAGYHTFRSYYKCPSFNVNFLSEKSESCDDFMTVNFTDTSVGATAWEWDVDGDDIVDYTEQNPTHVYGTGIYDVTLKISNGSEYLTKVFPEYINFSSNIYETSKVNLKLFIVDVGENTWDFKDSSGTILYQGGPYDQNGEKNHEFDVVQSECYTFTIYDSAGNGLDGYNWTVGSEYYELSTENESLIYTNTNFGFQESKLISTQYLNLNEFSENSISIFPNPADNYLQINYQNIMPKLYSIFDVNGRKIQSGNFINENDLTIDVRELEKGMYFISIGLSGELITLKFLIN
tara:strand:- start:29379 stop:31142 length:1764 start_codon:yes stop_codon:yes gene_type:complete